MIIEILGVGDAFSHQLGNTSFLAWEDDYSSAVLFECGNTVFSALREKEIKENREIIDKIDSVFISHLHDDHCGSLCTLLEYRYWMLHKKTKVTAPYSFWEIIRRRMDVFNADHINDGEDERIKMHPTEHYDYVSCAACYNGLLYSGDTKESLLGTYYAKEAKIIIHEVSTLRNSVHTHVDDLLIADESIKQKMYGIHYNLNNKETISKIMIDNGFCGLLEQNQIIKT